MCKRFLISLALWNVVHVLVHAQQYLHFNSYSLEEGLSQISVTGIQEDHQGYIWVSTTDGLNRFNGYEFTVFRNDPNDTSSLSHNNINALHFGSKQRLWVATLSGGLNWYDSKTGTFHRYMHLPDDANSLLSNRVTDISEDRQGNIWLATFGGVSKLNPSTQEFANFTLEAGQLPVNSITAIFCDANGRVWAGAEQHGLLLYDPERNTFEAAASHTPFAEKTITAITGGEGGVLWISSVDNGFGQLFTAENRFVHFRKTDEKNSVSSDFVASITVTKSGKLWIGTDEGLNIYDPSTGIFHQSLPEPSVPYSLNHKYVGNTFIDSNGMYWIGTSGGVNQFNPATARFNHFTHLPSREQSLSNKYVMSIFRDSENLLWIGTDGGGLNLFDSLSGTFQVFKNQQGNPASLSHNSVYAIAEDPADSTILWIATHGGGLNRFDKDTRKFRHFRHRPNDPTSISSDRVLALQFTNDSTLWVGLNGGFNQVNTKTNLVARVKATNAQNSTLEGDLVRKIVKDRKGRMWLATVEKGLVLFEPESRKLTSFTHSLSEPASLSHNIVLDILEDRKGRIWAATVEGINLFLEETQTFRSWQEEDGLSNNVVYTLLEDRNGAIWGATNLGLNQLQPETGEINWYDEADGLQSNEFNVGAAFKDQAGRLYFGGPNGFNFFYPEQLSGNQQPPSVVLSDFLLFNKPVKAGESPVLKESIEQAEEINLTYNDYIFAFEFSALNFQEPTKNQFAYRLEPFGAEWIYTNYKDRKATFTNVPHGTYTFRVKASNNDGIWNEQGATVRVVIHPPWWLSGYAKAAYVLAGLTLVVLVYLSFRRRIRQRERDLQKEKEISERLQTANDKLKSVDKLKDEFLANTSHELRTPLNGIIGIAESLVDGAGGDLNQKQLHDLSLLVASGKRLSGLVNDILDFSKLKNRDIQLRLREIDPFSSVNLVLRLSAPLAAGKDLQLINEISRGVGRVLADEDRFQQILLNLVGNAIKFTQQGAVKVSSERSGSFLKIAVSDTGIGIAAENLSSIFQSFEQADGSIEREYGGTGIGLSVTKKLIELHGGSLGVVSRPGQGSTFWFAIPLAEGASEEILTDESVTQERKPFMEPVKVEEAGTQFIESFTDQAFLQGRLEVLIVDDEPINLQVLENQLSLQNFNVTKAENGEKALELFQSDRHFDLILLDIMMPKISGYEVCEKIRAEIPPQHLPIILLTAKNRVEDIVAGFENGANDYLVKPFSKQELLARISTHIQLLKANRELETYNQELEQKVADRTRELEASYKTIEEAYQRLKSLEEFKEGMLGMIVHDLKNPLSVVLGLAEEEIVRQSAQQMLNMVNNILDIQKLESTQVNLSTSVCIIDDLFASILPQVSYLMEQKQLRLEQKWERSTALLADQDLVERVLVNLFTNAIKFSPVGSPLHLSAILEGEMVKVSLQDEGPGIPAEKVEMIFQKFGQAMAKASGGIKSTGLGLTFCKLAIEAHGGEIGVESTVGVGSTFWFSIPGTAMEGFD